MRLRLGLVWDRVDKSPHIKLGYITKFIIAKKPDFLPGNASLSVVEGEG